MREASLKSRLASALEAGHLELVGLGGGANSRVWQAAAADGRLWAVKQYASAERLNREWRALCFLADHGLAGVARPVIRSGSGAELWAVYSFLSGQIPEHQGRPEAVAPLAGFLAGLHQLGRHPAAAALPLASDDFLTPALWLRRLEYRLDRLLSLPRSTAPGEALARFLNRRLRPAFESRRTLAKTINPEAASLSPADLGFHNCLQQADAFSFVDFEHFGLDDPIQLVADTLLHPHERMRLTAAQQARFLALTADIYADIPHFPARVRARQPLSGLKWALIVLSDFLPDSARRRALAGQDDDGGARLWRQLALAEDLLDQSQEVVDGR